MPWLRGLLAVLTLLSGATPCLAQVYRYTDAQGQVHYTSQPPSNVNAESLNIPTTSSRAASAPSTSPSDNTPDATRSATQGYSVVRVTGVTDGQAVRANDGNLSVGVHLVPALQPGHRLRLLLDGQALDADSGASINLSGLERGEHSLQAEVLSGQQALQQSPVVRFNLQRTHVNAPARRAP